MNEPAVRDQLAALVEAFNAEQDPAELVRLYHEIERLRGKLKYPPAPDSDRKRCAAGEKRFIREATPAEAAFFRRNGSSALLVRIAELAPGIRHREVLHTMPEGRN